MKKVYIFLLIILFIPIDIKAEEISTSIKINKKQLNNNLLDQQFSFVLKDLEGNEISTEKK